MKMKTSNKLLLGLYLLSLAAWAGYLVWTLGSFRVVPM
jgi:hypothetical protein